MTADGHAEQDARLTAAQAEIEAVLDRHSLTGVYLLATEGQVVANTHFQPWSHIRDDPDNPDQMVVADDPFARAKAVQVCVALIGAIDSMRAQLSQIVRVLRALSRAAVDGTRPDPKTLD